MGSPTTGGDQPPRQPPTPGHRATAPARVLALEAQGRRKTVLGMVHLQPLPGTPYHQDGDLGQIVNTAVTSALALQAGGADGCLVQTVDRVYLVDDHADPARTAAMTLIVNAIAQATRDGFQIGVQLMYNALRASLAVAKVTGASFIRASALVGATLSPHGMVRADPAGVMAYRAAIAAQDIRIIADIDSMHFQWFGGSKPTTDVARVAGQVGADAVCLGHPDEPATLRLIASVRQATPRLPIILAGHTNHANAARLLAATDGAFVGSCLEPDGWGGRIDADRVKAYVDIVRSLER